MTLCNELTSAAQAWADRGVFEHCKDRNGAGENIAWNCAGTAEEAAAQAVDQWYGEIKDYNWSNAVFAMNTGHFTQVVWKGSTQLGIGVARCEMKGWNGWLVVGRYKRHGNMCGDFEANVMPKN